MMAPLIVSQEMGLLLAVILGIFFGFFLERGGLGDPHKLTGVFYLRDFTVPKVMFTAIIVAATGIYLLSDLKILDMNKVWIVPTFFWPQIVGGLIFGVGFVLSGYCPGTAVVSITSGRTDALITIVGIGAGSLIFAVLYPYIEDFYMLSGIGGAMLPGILGINHWIIIAFLYVFAGIMFYLMERYEK